MDHDQLYAYAYKRLQCMQYTSIIAMVVYTQYRLVLYCESCASAAVSPGLPQGDLQLLPVHPMLHQVLAVEVEHRNVKLIQPSPFLVASHINAALFQCYLRATTNYTQL